MFDFDSNEERHIPEPDLVPILDALTSVIFFLVLSTTFMEFTKVTVPPSKTSVITDPLRPPPVSGKILVQLDKKGSGLKLDLKWGGVSPDLVSENVTLIGDRADNHLIEDAANKIVSEYLSKYPDEKSIQVGFGKNVNYQQMISTMDGIRKRIQDIVLISYHEVN